MSRLHSAFSPDSIGPASRYGRPPASPAGVWVGWAIYAGLALVGFCFGVWAGTQRPKTVEVVRTNPAGDQAKADGKATEPRTETKTETRTNTGAKPNPTVNKGAEPKPNPMPMNNPDPNKPTEMKTAPNPDPKPKPNPEPMSTVAGGPTFEKDIQPIFKTNCVSCHGEKKNNDADLDLRTFAATKKGGENMGVGFVPGDPDKSNLWDRINDNSMPPKDSGKKLTAEEKKLIKDWIMAGAKEK